MSRALVSPAAKGVGTSVAYFVQWLKIGDEVEYNVVPMDAEDVLLGCQWMYDKKEIHQMRDNTYTFFKDG